MTEAWDTYPAAKLVNDVAQLLQERGVTPQPADDREAERIQAARKLLSSLGVTPTLSPEQSLDLDGHTSYNARVHGD
ncbi:hypothetical protein [Saccharopolyspora gregorii]|uniref:Uncharacterized protein n=1 Tax=Saccharopolyspora gregorii TaxID=33914 RepID=A0ABP6RGP3_9PSEU